MKPAGCAFVLRLLQALHLCFCPPDTAALHFSVSFPQVVTGILLIFLVILNLFGHIRTDKEIASIVLT